ncbi:sigma-54 dependent transcriptional regulator [Acinetobacter sp. MD2(2019)]|uniref:sigma-54-dependent transcriptional regulator n=1 Tax=Acinetobacter sp. MD2(2019) TaxID=2605273 RepID=UPI002D1EF131|nr:sigma-54 dependent transcriptional regulator [Acinetobacter sp. MD2(2019)]MEB3753312.1 sigma-54-dependent Fis family transcriptional regulator [Acinetobacter sp. MD2(2019)]
MNTQPNRVLLVDDEIDLCLLMQMTLKRMGIESELAHTVSDAKKKLRLQHFNACLTDLNLPDADGISLVEHMNQHYPNTPIAVISAYGNMEIAINALKAGAFDFISKPILPEALQQLLEKAIVPHETSNLNQPEIEDRCLIGHSAPMHQLKQTLRKISRTQAPIFITGESGTGKEVVANLVHQLSNRKNGPFIAINCGAIPAELMESELFGHKKGSFTNATHDKQGLIQSAHGGSLFLDEIAELPLNMQVKLLRAVQEKKIRPIGSDTEHAVDFRIISATHQNLEQLIQQGKFRQDLFFRLHVMNIELPPLRERGEDIIELARHFIQQICQEWGLANKQLTANAHAFLMQHAFTGNVRELRNMIERAITLCDDKQIDAVQLQGHVSPAHSVAENLATHPDIALSNSKIPDIQMSAPKQLPEQGLEAYLEQVEKDILLNALELTHWNRTLAAKKLGMSFRSLRYRLKKFGLDDEPALE